MLIREFALSAVEITEPVFVNAFNKEQEYLCSIEIDRLLAGFRETAGLEKKADRYTGGWENAEIAGHTLGHYMTALAQMYATTGTEESKERLEYILEELLECQSENGYLFASGEEIFDKLEKGGLVWMPWYTMHKLLSGLLAVYRLAKMPQALTIAIRLGNWASERVLNWTEKAQRNVRCIADGGMNDCLYELYKETGKEEFAEAAAKFDETELYEQILEGKDVLRNKHANNTIPKFLGAINRYMALGESEKFYLDAAKTFFDVVVKDHTYVIGGNGEWEHFRMAGELGESRNQCNCETCSSYNMLKLAERLYAVTGEKRYMDYYERTFLNAILGSQNPEDGMTTFFQPMATGFFKTFGAPFTKFWCCTGTGMESFTKLNHAIYHTTGDTLYVNLYIASVLRSEEHGLLLTQTVDMDRLDSVALTMKLDAPKKFTLCLRLPEWSEGAPEITVNGSTADYTVKNGYLCLDGTWKDGDRVVLKLSPVIAVHPLPDMENCVAATYGPWVLAAGLGQEDMTTELTGVNVTVPTKKVSVRERIVLNEELKLAEWFENCKENFVKSEEELAFSLQGTDADETLVFTPYYKHYDDRYGIYFNYHDMDNLPEDLRKELEEQKRLEEERLAAEAAEAERLRLEAEAEAERLRLEAEAEAERLRLEAEEAERLRREEEERLRREEEERAAAEAARLAAEAAAAAEAARLAAEEEERRRIEEEERKKREAEEAERRRIEEEERARREAEEAERRRIEEEERARREAEEAERRRKEEEELAAIRAAEEAAAAEARRIEEEARIEAEAKRVAAQAVADAEREAELAEARAREEEANLQAARFAAERAEAEAIVKKAQAEAEEADRVAEAAKAAKAEETAKLDKAKKTSKKTIKKRYRRYGRSNAGKVVAWIFGILLALILLYLFATPISKVCFMAKDAVDTFVADKFPKVAETLGIKGDGDVIPVFKDVSTTVHFVEDADEFVAGTTWPEGYRASVVRLNGKQYICIEGNGLKTYYLNEVAENESKHVYLEKGDKKALYFWDYSFDSPEDLCPLSGVFNGAETEQYAFYMDGAKSNVHVLDAVTLEECKIIPYEETVEQMLNVEAYTEGDTDLRVDMTVAEVSYSFSVPKKTGLFIMEDYELRLDSLGYTMTEEGVRFDAYVMSADSYLGKVVGRMEYTNQVYVLNQLDFYAYAEEEFGNVSEDPVIAATTLESAEKERIAVAGDRGERLLIPVREDVKRYSYNEESFLKEDNGEISYVQNGKTVSVKGIDVSKYQEKIDWETVAASGVEYAMIRLGFRGMGTNGTCELDTYYKRNVQGALDAGIEVGVYFFSQATTVEEAKEEAQFMLKYIKDYDITWPVAYDTEEISSYEAARANSISREDRTACAKAFMDEIAAAGYTPMLYANTRWSVLKLDLGQLADYDLWYAYYGESPYYPYHYTMWQYTNVGEIPGINGNADVNISFVDYGAAKEQEQ
ncbi:MAG: glycoside hydrolase family 127 protein [Lachnospiraceae bacterium]|nr:glycoside hydrolase family 127 protein [Lachnospiraceae bacterium]